MILLLFRTVLCVACVIWKHIVCFLPSSTLIYVNCLFWCSCFRLYSSLWGLRYLDAAPFFLSKVLHAVYGICMQFFLFIQFFVRFELIWCSSFSLRNLDFFIWFVYLDAVTLIFCYLVKFIFISMRFFSLIQLFMWFVLFWCSLFRLRILVRFFVFLCYLNTYVFPCTVHYVFFVIWVHYLIFWYLGKICGLFAYSSFRLWL